METDRSLYTIDNSTGCWNWNRSVTKDGYGRITIGGKYWGAHRYAYYMRNGDIPEGMLVCHKCDNPKCVNPDHLFLGSHKDNIVDSVEKGRFPRGEGKSWSKLTEKDVLEIRKKHVPYYVTCKQLAEKYNVSEKTINAIINRKIWKHV